jgi:hypothetical protein
MDTDRLVGLDDVVDVELEGGVRITRRCGRREFIEGEVGLRFIEYGRS